jgi:RimJ/RimL family protein N-acetyltransferase
MQETIIAGRAPRFIMGKRVTLRRIESGDLASFRRWLDDPELRAQIGATAPMSEAEALEWYREVSADQRRVWYAILDEKDVLIGECGHLRMSPEWRT